MNIIRCFKKAYNIRRKALLNQYKSEQSKIPNIFFYEFCYYSLKIFINLFIKYFKKFYNFSGKLDFGYPKTNKK